MFDVIGLNIRPIATVHLDRLHQTCWVHLDLLDIKVQSRHVCKGFFFCHGSLKNRATHNAAYLTPRPGSGPPPPRLSEAWNHPATAQHLRCNKEREKALAAVQAMRVHHRRNQQNMVDFLMSSGSDLALAAAGEAKTA